MGEVIGFLRDDQATFGEKAVLQKLENGLPPEFTIYVECPIPTRTIARFPDFIVVSNFGVVVLEVKDWVHVSRFDPSGVDVYEKDGRTRREHNPVTTARGYSLVLNQRLETIPQLVDDRRHRTNVPWGYAVVFPHLPISTITQMRTTWGEHNVLNLDDLHPDRVTQRLKATVPRDVALHREELSLIRAAIFPVVVIEAAGNRRTGVQARPAIILDEAQEKLVAEPVRAKTPEPESTPEAALQADFLETVELLIPAKVEEQGIEQEKKTIEEKISQNLSVRLVRGIAGSGKSLVLQQRAHYLSAQYPQWEILVLTFNKNLATKLEKSFRRTSIKAMTFHKLCRQLMTEDSQEKVFIESEGWVERWAENYPIVEQFGARFISGEITWLIEMGYDRLLEDYLQAERKGRGRDARLLRGEREAIFNILNDYREFLNGGNQCDWADLPRLAIEALTEGGGQVPVFDAILIDEAQDFAPSWISVVKRLLKPEQGLLFLADDPMQSIYRYYSWREKGVPVVGRSRWLRIPYRTTREIYQAAYEIIHNDEILKSAIENETGLLVEPDIEVLRSGERPKLHRFARIEDEASFIRSEIDRLHILGINPEEIAVLCRKKNDLQRIKNLLHGTGITIETFHSSKGLEYEVIYLSQLQDTFQQVSSEQELSQERRTVYMAMTRARNYLHLCFEGAWPKEMQAIQRFID